MGVTSSRVFGAEQKGGMRLGVWRGKKGEEATDADGSKSALKCLCPQCLFSQYVQESIGRKRKETRTLRVYGEESGDDDDVESCNSVFFGLTMEAFKKSSNCAFVLFDATTSLRPGGLAIQYCFCIANRFYFVLSAIFSGFESLGSKIPRRALIRKLKTEIRNSFFFLRRCYTS